MSNLIINRPAFDANKLTTGSAFKVTVNMKARNTMGKNLHALRNSNVLVTKLAPFAIYVACVADGMVEAITIKLGDVQSGLVTLTPLVLETQAEEKNPLEEL